MIMDLDLSKEIVNWQKFCEKQVEKPLYCGLSEITIASASSYHPGTNTYTHTNSSNQGTTTSTTTTI